MSNGTIIYGVTDELNYYYFLQMNVTESHEDLANFVQINRNDASNIKYCTVLYQTQSKYCHFYMGKQLVIECQLKIHKISYILLQLIKKSDKNKLIIFHDTHLHVN